MKNNRLLLVPITFLSLALTFFVISLSCKDNSKKAETVDSTVKIKQSPPLGAQGMASEQGIGKSIDFSLESTAGEGDVAMAVPPIGTVRVVLENKDTQVQTTRKKAVSYIQTDIVTLPYKGTTTPPANKPPTANAGADKVLTLPTNSTSLVGSGTDPDGTIASYTWTKVSGGAATIKTVGAATTVVEGLVQGSYTFRLTVKDNGGLTATDDVIVTVNAATTPPPPPPPPPPTVGIKYLSLPLSGPLDLSGQSNVIVENKRFSNIQGIAIKLYNGANNITIRNCFFDGATMELVELENATNITIENCLFARAWAGVYAVGSKNVKVINCQFVNMKIKYNNGQFAGRGVFVQMNSCDGGEVSGCKGENFDGESDPEDLVSCYGGSSNIVIKNNMFRGGPNGGPSKSGGGIIVGDTGGNNCIIENNTLLRPGNYGYAVAGGKFNKIINNKVYSEKTLVSNNPLYVANYSGDIGCSDITVSGNRVNWIDKAGNRNNGWNSGECANTPYNPADNQTITLAEMGVPDHLITFLTPAELLTIRK